MRKGGGVLPISRTWGVLWRRASGMWGGGGGGGEGAETRKACRGRGGGGGRGTKAERVVCRLVIPHVFTF